VTFPTGSLRAKTSTWAMIKLQHRDRNISTLIHQRVEAARTGTNPTVICRMPSGRAVLCDVQFLRGYSLLLPDPVVPDLNALDKQKRAEKKPVPGNGNMITLLPSRIGYHSIPILVRVSHQHQLAHYSNDTHPNHLHPYSERKS